MRYWLVKSEPENYGWEHLLAEGDADWDGVRNYQARNYLREAQVNDLVLFYHSGKNPSVVGTAKVSRGPFPDPTDDSGKWTAIGISPLEKLASPVSLKVIKQTGPLQGMTLLKMSRLSVQPVAKDEFHHILHLSQSADNGR